MTFVNEKRDNPEMNFQVQNATQRDLARRIQMRCPASGKFNPWFFYLPFRRINASAPTPNAAIVAGSGAGCASKVRPPREGFRFRIPGSLLSFGWIERVS